MPRAVIEPSPVVNLRLTYTNEDESRAPKVTDYSLFYRQSAVPRQPHHRSRHDAKFPIRFSVWDGNHSRSISWRTTASAFRSSIPVIHFSQVILNSRATKPTERFPSLRLDGVFSSSLSFASALRPGMSSGTLPLQRYFSVESGAAGTAPFGVMHAMGLKEFRGTSYIAIGVEHNFRSIPFLWLGLPQSIRHNLEFVIHVGAANSWGEGIFPHHAKDGSTRRELA